jgi:hypothetical protein
VNRALRLSVVVFAAVVAATTVSYAIRHDTIAPIWEMAWLPAVVTAVLYRRSARRCSPRA